MANDTTNTTSEFDIEYPANGYDATPTWAELYGAAFEDIDSALADRLVEEEVEDVVDALLAGGDKVSVSYDDANDQLTIDTSALDAEEVRDEVGSLLAAGNALTATVDDAGDTVTLAVDESAISHDNIADVAEGDHRSDEQVRDLAGSMAGDALSHDDAGDTIDVQREQIEDWVGGLVAGQGNVSVQYDDANDVLQIDTSALDQEEVQDAVSQLVAAGDNLSWNYDDANGVLTVSLSGAITGHAIGTSSSPAPESHFESVSTDEVSIANLSAVLEKTTAQSISADTTTTIDWDSQDIDTVLYSYDGSANTISVLSAGDYAVAGALKYTGLADQDEIRAHISVNGSIARRFFVRASGSGDQAVPFAATLKDLSENDSIEIQARTDAANDVVGTPEDSFATITRSG